MGIVNTKIYTCDACKKQATEDEYNATLDWRSAFYHRSSPSFTFHAFLTACSYECHRTLGSNEASQITDEQVPANVRPVEIKPRRKVTLPEPKKTEVEDGDDERTRTDRAVSHL